MKHSFCWLLLTALAWAQPIVPGTTLPHVPNRVLETSGMLEGKFLFAEGQRLHRQGQLSRAADLYSKALSSDPEALEYRPYLARVSESLGQHQQALDQYNLYLAQEPQDFSVRIARLLPLIALKFWDEVDAELANLDARELGNADYLLYKGLNWLERQQAGKAEGSLRAALVLAPQRWDIRNNLATALLLQDKPQEALDILPGQGDYALADLLRGVAFYRLGQVERAEQVWQILVPSSQLLEAYLNLATLLAQNGQETQALRLSAQALDLQPDSPAGRLLYARLLTRNSRFEEALGVLQPLLQSGVSKDLDCYFKEMMGLILLGLKRDGEALEYWQQALLTGGETLWLQHNLALVLSRLGRWDEALSYQEKVIKIEYDQTSSWYLLATLYEKSSKFKQAREAYAKYLSLENNEQLSGAVRQHLKKIP